MNLKFAALFLSTLNPFDSISFIEDEQDITIQENIKRYWDQNLGFFDSIIATGDIIIGNHYGSIDFLINGARSQAKSVLDICILTLLFRSIYYLNNNKIGVLLACIDMAARGIIGAALTFCLIPMIALTVFARYLFALLSSTFYTEEIGNEISDKLLDNIRI